MNTNNTLPLLPRRYSTKPRDFRYFTGSLYVLGTLPKDLAFGALQFVDAAVFEQRRVFTAMGVTVPHFEYAVLDLRTEYAGLKLIDRREVAGLQAEYKCSVPEALLLIADDDRAWEDDECGGAA